MIPSTRILKPWRLCQTRLTSGAMSELLLHYKRPDPTTWAYLSSFLTIGLFFVFHRFWSIRNLDIGLVILLSPGLLMVHDGRRGELEALEASAAAAPTGQDPATSAGSANGQQADLSMAEAQLAEDQIAEDQIAEDQIAEAQLAADRLAGPLEEARGLQRLGFIWLLGVQVLILLRLLLDPAMVRRPLLDPNLTTGGLNFIGISLLVFLMANVITSTPRLQIQQGPQLGPGYALINMLPTIPTRPDADALDGAAIDPAEVPPRRMAYAAIARVVAIGAHLAVVGGIVMIGYRHFGNLRAGAGCATLYLMLPYTAQMTGRVDHALPAAMLVWAVLFYRRPLLAGIFLGLAAGLVYYPLFLLPLWISFYWQRGLGRFCGSVAGTLLLLMLLLSLGGTGQLDDRLRQMYGLWWPTMEGLKGIWGLGWLPIWRLPVLVAFMLLSGFYAVWPAQKNLGTLISCSASLMVAAQFWHGYGGGLYLAWFLPLLLLTIFRPNLEDRVALKVIGSGQLTATNRRRDAGIEAA